MLKRGQVDEPLIGNRREINITYAAPREEILGVPITLPTAEPATPTFSYIIQENDLPTFDAKPFSVQYRACPIASGKNSDLANARSISYRAKKNGASVFVYTNQSVPAGQYWTVTLMDMANIGNVQVGDIIDFYLWQTTPGALYMDYKALAVGFKRLFITPYKKNAIIFNLAVTTAGGFPQMTLGNPSTSPYDANYVYNGPNSSGFTTSRSFPAASQNPTNGICSVVWGDVNNSYGTVKVSATLHPNPVMDAKLIKIEWHPTAITGNEG